jgi:sterol desaturase/sphingolipid hydroxylase (fatty acid hydroxylase superfamily)
MAAQPGRILLDALDRIVCSSANYWVAMFGDLAAALAFFAFGLGRFPGRFVVAAVIVTVGFLTAGLIEYAVHRWVLHGPPSVARRGHLQHHADPQALVSAPLFMIMATALLIWWLLSFGLGSGAAALLVAGLYAGYNYFAVVHHLQHRRGTSLTAIAYYRRLEHVHHLHHHRQVVNFGISTTLWDRIFGTFQPTREPAGSARDQGLLRGRILRRL